MDTSEKTNPSSEVELGDKRSLGGYIFLHFINDMHSTALPAVIPILLKTISISLTQAGLLNALFGITNIFLQPVVGYFADRQKRPCFAVWGPMMSVAGACLLPLSPNYGIAFLLVGSMSMGTSLFHPQGFGRSGSAAGQKNLAFYISMFAASGSLGSAVGPLYIVFMISLIGTKWLPLTLVPVFFICLYIWINVAAPQKTENIPKEPANYINFFRNIKMLIGEIGGIVAASSIRDATFQGIKLFLPVLIITRGGTIQGGGFILFAVTLAGTIAGIIGGRLADSIGAQRILIGTISAAPLFLLLGLRTSGVASICALMLGCAFLQASSPVTTAMAQQQCPGARSAASSLAMGVSWGIANLFTSPVGFSADRIGLDATLSIVAFMPWVVTALYIAKRLYTAK